MSNSLTVPSSTALKPLALHDLVTGYESEDLYASFRAKDGALVDLRGLDAIAAISDRVMSGVVCGTAATDNNLILSGLDVSGSPQNWLAEMPDGDSVRRIPIDTRGLMLLGSEVSVSAGMGVVRDRRGRPHVVRLEKPVAPENAMPREPSALVLSAEIVQDDLSSRERVVPHVRFVPLSEARAPHHLILAMQAKPDSTLWATDIQRLLQPEHPIINGIMSLLSHLEHVTWTEDRHGWPWEKFQQGREWSRYQTTSTLALQATRTALQGHASTTTDRIRLLRNLHFQLRRSIEKAERNMLKWVGTTQAPDPYRVIFPIDAALTIPPGRRFGGLVQEFQGLFSTYSLRNEGKTAKYAYAEIFLYAPLNRIGYDTMVSQLTELGEFLRKQARAKPGSLTPEDVNLIIRAGQTGHTISLADPTRIVDTLVQMTGWEPR